MDWSVALTAFGGALVEFVEAAIIVVAAVALANWRPALAGTAVAAVVLAAVVAVLGYGVLRLVPLPLLRGIVGALLLLFGVKWLTKAVLRIGAPLPPKPGHHEGADGGGPQVAFATAFNGVLLEGAEVVFIVLGLGSAGAAHSRVGALDSATLGAVVAGLLCILGAVAARRTLAAVPDVVLKFLVGTMLTSFGTLWLGEAAGVPWWGGDVSVAWIAVANALFALAAVALLRRSRRLAAAAGAARGQVA
jgi:uncharacterized membrane protein